MSKKLGLVKCRICGEHIDRQNQDDWIMPSKNYFYHKICYDTWGKKKNDVHAKATNKEWQDMLWEYLRKDLKIDVDFNKLNNQWNSFLKKGMTAKGMYFCIKYFYEVKNGDPKKSENGIGIIPYIYEECASYWQKREKDQKGICAKIEEQIKQTYRQKRIVVNQKQEKTRVRANYSLDDIEDMPEEL